MNQKLAQSDERLKREDNLANSPIFKKTRSGGRKNGDANLSPMMRSIIGAAAEIDGSSRKTAKIFGRSTAAVDQYRKGRTSHKQPIKAIARDEVQKNVEVARSKTQEVKDKAIDRLSSLFDQDGPISDQNLKTLKAREGISAAKDLASVIDRVTPKTVQQDQRVQLVIFSPRTREEKEYEAIDVEAVEQ